MDRRTKQVAAVACLVAIVGFTFVVLPLDKWFRAKEAVTAVQLERARAAVEKHPELRPAWDKALEDGVLTPDEATELLGRVGQKLDP